MTDIASVVRILVILLLTALTVILVTRRLAVPYTLGLVVVGLLISIFDFLPDVRLRPDLILFVFLPALLFEGSWMMYVRYLRENWRTIFLLVGPGLLLSLVLIAVPLHFFAGLNWGLAFLLGAILSPTDPVAVLGLFRQLKVDIRLSTIIEGESLFNDGVAGALYSTFLGLVLLSVQGQPITAGQAWLNGILIFLLEAGGGYGRNIGMSEATREAVDNFWSTLAFIANALLFLLVGAQLNPKEFFSSDTAFPLLLTAGLTILAVLVARLVVVVLLPPIRQSATALSLWRAVPYSWRVVIFWSGLRGALSLALVLALPVGVPSRNTLIFSTYAVVLFTLLVQGFSLRLILRRLPSVSG